MSEPLYRCHRCKDDPAGWVVVLCTGKTCNRRFPHPEHEQAVRCRCWLLRNADAIRLYGQKIISKGLNPPTTFQQLQDLEASRYTEDETWC
jgi:hypothetical protein